MIIDISQVLKGEGETLELVTLGKITDVGTVTNSVKSYKILKANGDDSSNNYDFDYFEMKTKSQLLNMIWELQKEYEKLKNKSR